MTKKLITMLLTAAMLLAAVGCTPSKPAENSSSSSMTQEEIDALKEENERLQQELDALKGEDTETEDEDAESETDPSSEAAGNSGASSQASTPATTQALAANNNSSSAAASKPNSQATASTPTPPTSAQQQAPASSQPAAPAANSSTPAPQKTGSGKGPLAKYTVNVKDKSTPAVDVRGKSYEGQLAYVFYSEDGDVVGTIPDSAVGVIIRQEGLTQAEDDEQKSWFVENFNIYRGLNGGEYESSTPSGGSSNSSEIDIEEFRDEVIRLTNKERENAGLEPFEVHDTAMEFAQIRAEELAELYSHERPNGDKTGDYGQYTFGENIAYGQKSPKEVVADWMASPGHRDAIMSSEDEYFGVGVYKSGGTIYWVQEFIWWDSEG